MVKKLKTLKLIAGLTLLTSVMLFSFMGCGWTKEDQEAQDKYEKEKEEREKEATRIEVEHKYVHPYLSDIYDDAALFCSNVPCLDVPSHAYPTKEFALDEYVKLNGREATDSDHARIKTDAAKFHKDQHIGL